MQAGGGAGQCLTTGPVNTGFYGWPALRASGGPPPGARALLMDGPQLMQGPGGGVWVGGTTQLAGAWRGDAPGTEAGDTARCGSQDRLICPKRYSSSQVPSGPAPFPESGYVPRVWSGRRLCVGPAYGDSKTGLILRGDTANTAGQAPAAR
ncbi:unnamed protein product [Gadus morhua 'NCC']